MIKAKQSSQMPWYRKAAHYTARFFLKDEYAKIALQRDTFVQAQKGLEDTQKVLDEERAAFNKWAGEHTVVDAVRIMLKGFDPRTIDQEGDLPEILGDVEDQDSFLAKCNALKENEAFPVILAYLTRNQILFSAKEALTLESINFGRSTINGLALLKEEVDRLSTIYKARHAPKETFDEHDVV